MLAAASAPTWHSSLASSMAACAFGLVLLVAPCDAQTASVVTTGTARPIRQETPVMATMIEPDTARPASPDGIRPFHVDVPEEALVDLRRRIAATRWPDRGTVTDRSQGVRLSKFQDLVRYWGTNYNWRKVEARLNALPQFATTIDGVDIQFIHVRSRHPNALPLIITHGWPGSLLELVKVIGTRGAAAMRR